MELPWNTLVREWPTLQGVMQSVLTVAFACLVFGWIAGRFMYGQRIEGLKDELTRADRRIAEYKDQLNGATPQEVRARIDALEAQLAKIKPAELSATQLSDLRKAVAKIPRGTITLAHYMGSDPGRMPTQFREVFVEHGWGISDAMMLGQDDPAPSGIALQISPIAEFLPQSLAVKNALEAAKIEFSIYKLDERSPDQNPKLCFTRAS